MQYSLAVTQTLALESRFEVADGKAVSTIVQRRMHFATVLDARVLLGYSSSLLYHISGLHSMRKHLFIHCKYWMDGCVSTNTGYYLFEVEAEVEVARLRLQS